MKKYGIVMVVVGLLLAFCSGVQAVPLEWVRQSDSPVLDTGGPSPYESYHVSYPSVLIQDEIYKMWYAGYRAGPSPRGGICYATSTDKGLTWTKHGTVLEVTEEWEQNSPPETYNYVNYPRVIYEEGMYKMWYNATGLSRGYATSTDGINWDNKTQQLGHGYAYAEVVKGPSDYKLYYNKSGGIYVMESSDGGVSDPWEVANQDNPVLEPGAPGEWDSLAVLQPNVRYDPGIGKFQMWYRGSATPSLVPSKIGFALSDDGLTWEKCLANPILEPIAGTWERDAVWPGSTVFDHTDNTYRMFYGGYHFDHQAIGLAAAVSPEPACWSEQDKLLASDAAANDHFGNSVGISGDIAILGAYFDDDNGDYSGSAYLFDVVTGSQLAKLTASDGAAWDYFGVNLAIGGNTAIVGAFFDDDAGTNSGSAYLYDFSNPCNIIEIKLTASDAAAGDNFGHDVAISGNTAIVGAYADDDNGTDSGSVYLFDISDPCNPVEITKLTASDGAGGDYFGEFVAISSDFIIVGAPYDDNAGSVNSGSAYIFTPNEVDPNNWDQVAKLVASDGAAGDLFGISMAISGSTAIVGAPYDDDVGSNSGSAYVFTPNEVDPNNWDQVAKLVASDGAADDFFGATMAISGNTAIVSAYDDDGSSSGSAYLFDVSDPCNPIEIDKITPSDGAAMDRFGISVAISGGTAIVGAYGNDDNGTNSGSAYVFENICNAEPVASAGGPYIAQATSWSGAWVGLDGTGSSDPDGDAITYEWDLDLSVDSDGDGDPNNDVDDTQPTLSRVFPIGQTEISLVVIDVYGLRSEPDVTTVTVSFIEVDIDIKPGSYPNSINMGSNGVIPVAFLTDEYFDASTIDPATVTLRGEDFADGLVKLRGKKDAPVPMSNLEDIDDDGDLDLVVHLVTEKLAEHELEAMCELGALTYDGFVVSGSDTIQIVPY